MALPRNWERLILRGIGAPATPQNLQFLAEWHAREGGGDKNSANFNPLNTTQGAAGASSMNSVGVKSYRSPGQGIRATVQTLLNGHYGDIVGGLRSGKASAASLANSESLGVWGTGRWGAGKPPKLSGTGPGSVAAMSAAAPQAANDAAPGGFKQAVAMYLLENSQRLAEGGRIDPNSLLQLALARQQSLSQQSAQPSPLRRATAPPSERVEPGKGQINELFYDPIGGVKHGQQIGAIGNHSDHVHFSLSTLQAQLRAEQRARQLGLHVGEEQDSDVNPVHTSTSYHYRRYGKTKYRQAADVSGSPTRMAQFYRWVEANH